MQGFDYSSDNLYFVTICVQDRVCCFGSLGTGRDLSVLDADGFNSNVFVNKMILNVFGKIVFDRILWLAEQYKYVELHNFVVMPNHVHAIIEIVSGNTGGTGHDLFVLEGHEEIKIKSLSSLIGAFKTTSSKLIHECGYIDFAWQRSFHDHIIRDEKAYLNISNYIDANPDKWNVDTFFEKN